MRYDARVIVLAIDMYFNGLSLNSVARILNDHFDLKTGPTKRIKQRKLMRDYKRYSVCVVL